MSRTAPGMTTTDLTRSTVVGLAAGCGAHADQIREAVAPSAGRSARPSARSARSVRARPAEHGRLDPGVLVLHERRLLVLGGRGGGRRGRGAATGAAGRRVDPSTTRPRLRAGRTSRTSASRRQAGCPGLRARRYARDTARPSQQARGVLAVAADLVGVAGQPPLLVHRHERVELDGQGDERDHQRHQREQQDVGGSRPQMGDVAQGPAEEEPDGREGERHLSASGAVAATAR